MGTPLTEPQPHATEQHPYGTHDHQHHHGHQHATRNQLRLGFYLTIGILLIEVAGGFISHSLAVFSDAGHVLTDVVALGLAWFAAMQAERPPNPRRTFGYHRAGILTALVNGSLLVVIAAVIAYEAWQRFSSPEPVTAVVMGLTAVVPILVNTVIARQFHAAHSHDLNVRAVSLHVLGDIGASVAVVIAAIAIGLTGALWVDPLVSALIAVLIAVGAVRLITEALDILMEGAPRGLSTSAVAKDICACDGVYAVHDLHVWTISSGMRALSCHVMIDDVPPSASAALLDNLSRMLRDCYSIGHVTVQFESRGHARHEGFCACKPGQDTLYCELHPVNN